MHILFFNTKGGVGKSTLCEYTSRYLSFMNKKVNIENTDQQIHVSLNKDKEADYFLYDTAGAFTDKNMSLLKAVNKFNAKVIVPIKVGLNDFKEIDFLNEKLNELGIKNNTTVVFTHARKNNKKIKILKEKLNEFGISSFDWVMPFLQDFAFQEDTKRTKNEMDLFLGELL